MSAVDSSQTVAHVLRHHEETRSIFLRHRIQVESAGDLTLAELCVERDIDLKTFLRELERVIEESEAFDVGVFEWDLGTDAVRISPNLAGMLGIKGSMIGPPHAVLERIHPDDRPRVEALIKSARERPRTLSGEYHIVRPDGSMRLLAMQLEPVGPGPASLIGTTWDISEQRARGGLLESSSFVRSTLEATVDGILVVDRAGKALVYNERFLALWRIPHAIAAIGTDEALISFVLDQLEDPRTFLAGVHMLYMNPDRESFDVLRFRDGRVFERYSRPQRSRFAIIGRVWSFRDVTERERMLVRQMLLVDASRLLASLDIESALGAVATATVPLMGEACAVDVFEDGRSSRMVSRGVTPALPIAPVQVSDIRRSHPEVRDQNAISTIMAPLCVRQKSVGAISFASARKRYTRADLGLVDQLASRIALALENARLLSEARQAAHVRDDFLSVAAHEIRGPLSSIHLAAQAMQRPDLDRETRNKMLEAVTREDRRLGRFVDDLIEVTKIRTGGLRFEDEDVDLADVIRAVSERSKTEVERSRSTLSIDTPRPVVGHWDRFRLEQIVGNLLLNAVKFGLGNPIEISARAQDHEATLVVRDHGIGIPPDQSEAVFRPFERAVSARHYGGLGLGLFIVRSIVARYGGSVHVEPAEGGGSRFIVRLPQTRPS